MNRDAIEPIEAAPTSVRKVRELGRGRAATAYLVEATFADGSTIRCVEKLFRPGWLTRTIYRLAFFAPFAYQYNRDAICACFFRRRVAADVLRRAGVDVDVAAPLYVRFDPAGPGWVLAAEFVPGRGVRPASRQDPDPEIDQLLAVMKASQRALVAAGLTGSGWQVDPKAMVSTANLLRCGDRYTIVDLESGIPALLVPQYIALAARCGSLPPFDDLDRDRLGQQQGDFTSDIESLIRHNDAWKRAEPAALRRSTWERLARAAKRSCSKHVRGLWHLFTRPRYQTFVGLRYIRRSIRRWQSESRISEREAKELLEQVDDREVVSYVRGLAVHLALKPLSPLIVSFKYGGLAATVATGNVWFLLPFLVLPLIRTLVTGLNWFASGRQVRHAEAFCIGMIPTAGSLAFPVQLFVTRPDLATFLIRDIASKFGRKLPVYGGKDSRTELAMIRWADRLVGMLWFVLRPAVRNRGVKTESNSERIALHVIDAAEREPAPVLHREAV